MSSWLEISLDVTHEAVEAVAEILTEAGSKGVAIEDPQLINELRSSGVWELCGIPAQEHTEMVTVSGYYADDECLQQRLEHIQKELDAVEERIGSFRFGNTRFRRVSEQDWANEWKQYFHTAHVGRTLVIKPSWEEYAPAPGERVIEIDPGMAFGTGTHHTTNMMLERLERVLPGDAVVFDVGTGSGILAIGAALCGARRVRAVDIDGVAVRTARENVAQNRLSDKIEVRQGDLLHGTEGRADVIVANILAAIIILLLKDVPARLRENGIFLASGILEEQAAEVEAEAVRQGMRVDAVDRRGGWVVMQMSRVK